MKGTRFVAAAALRSRAGMWALLPGALILTVVLSLAPIAGATSIKPGSSPDSRSDGRANPSAAAVEGAHGLAQGFRPAAAAVEDDSAPAPVPEPSSLLVFATGLLLGGRALRARSRN